MEKAVKESGDEKLIEDWRKLQTSDHFYYMCTKWFSDGDVHKYFNPYNSPYDAYINFMNVLDNLDYRCREAIVKKQQRECITRSRQEVLMQRTGHTNRPNSSELFKNHA